jgi:hypothetical protein
MSQITLPRKEYAKLIKSAFVILTILPVEIEDSYRNDGQRQEYVQAERKICSVSMMRGRTADDFVAMRCSNQESENQARHAAICDQLSARQFVQQVGGVIAKEIDSGIKNQGAHNSSEITDFLPEQYYHPRRRSYKRDVVAKVAEKPPANA